MCSVAGNAVYCRVEGERRSVWRWGHVDLCLVALGNIFFE